jgi:hypothetical protein
MSEDPAQPIRGDRQRRYQYLLSRWFTPLEARELSAIPQQTPAIRLLISARAERRAAFEKRASGYLASGQWKPEDVPKKWMSNIRKLYTTAKWRVQEGPRGRQQPMPKGSPNPWAMYRAAEKVAPGKRYISPWQLRQIRSGSTRLEQGLIFVQRAERQGGASLLQISEWIREKNVAIAGSKGQRKAQLIIERDRLAKLLE